MPDTSGFIPKFRVYIAISQKNDEILVSPMVKSPLSPYPEEDAGYSWDEFEPVSMLEFGSSPAVFGKVVKASIQVSMGHTSALYSKDLRKKQEKRRKTLVKMFGKDHPRFNHFSTSYRASTASNFILFKDEYDHILVEDADDTFLNLITSTPNLQLINRHKNDQLQLHFSHWVYISDLRPVQKKYPYNRPENELGQAILNLCKSKA